MEKTTSPSSLKPRYDLLDGLRGVAAMMVLFYHVFNDAKAFYVGAVSEFFHGFLGVDFFFILSGFVMGYAYDQRWSQMSLGNFVKRRLVRLHPMVIMGVLLGLVAYIIQGCVRWDGTEVATSALMITTLLALFLLPTPTDMEVRGFTEAFPLNGPHWSLFFEYIGSLLYALLLRKLPTRWLTAWVLLSILGITSFSLLSTDGGVAYGWSSEPHNVLGGALRMLYAYPMGLLMARLFREYKPGTLRGPVFLLCALVVILAQGLPCLGGKVVETVFQLTCIFVVFPLVIWYAARGTVNGWKQNVVSFLGRLSYPLYAIHYPFVYLYIVWVGRDGNAYQSYSQPWVPAIVTIVVSILAATIALLCYDEPLRKRLSKK